MNKKIAALVSVLCVALVVVGGYAYYISTLEISVSWTVELGGNLHLYDKDMVELSTPTIDFGKIPYHGQVTWDGYISFEGNGECALQIDFPIDDAYEFQTDYVDPLIGPTPVGFSITLFDGDMQYGTPYSGIITITAIEP